MRTFNVTLFPMRQRVTVQAGTTMEAADLANETDADWAEVTRADVVWKEHPSFRKGAPPLPSGVRVIFR